MKEKQDEGEEDKEQKEKDDEEQTSEEHEEKTEEQNIKPKHRKSFNLFKRKKGEKKAEKEEEKSEERGEPDDETQEDEKKEETPADDKEGEDLKTQEGAVAEEEEQVPELDRKRKGRGSFNLFKRKSKNMASVEEIIAEDKDESKETQDVKKEDVQTLEGTEAEEQKTKEQDEKEQQASEEQASELDTKPKLRRSFNLFKKRPQSMAAADRRTDEGGEEKVMSRHDPVRHSYHAGDLPVPDPSNLRKDLLLLFLQVQGWGREGDDKVIHPVRLVEWRRGEGG